MMQLFNKKYEGSLNTMIIEGTAKELEAMSKFQKGNR